MTPEPGQFASRFTNQYGDEWEFEYDYGKRKGLLRGSDVDWRSYVVIDGQARGLILNEEEIQWLRAKWSEATSSQRQR